jgi:hypothetical protein
MNFFIEWALAVHRAIWFPVFWTLGLDRPATDIPLEIGTAVLTAPAKPAKPGRRSVKLVA